jgi:hypothetical protein
MGRVCEGRARLDVRLPAEQELEQSVQHTRHQGSQTKPAEHGRSSLQEKNVYTKILGPKKISYFLKLRHHSDFTSLQSYGSGFGSVR